MGLLRVGKKVYSYIKRHEFLKEKKFRKKTFRSGRLISGERRGGRY